MIAFLSGAIVTSALLLSFIWYGILKLSNNHFASSLLSQRFFKSIVLFTDIFSEEIPSATRTNSAGIWLAKLYSILAATQQPEWVTSSAVGS